jgi:hypothetical protein
MPNARESEPTLKIRGDSQTLVDPLKLTPLSTIELGSESQEDVMWLSEYKSDRSHLVVVQQTPKCKKVMVGAIQKSAMEGFEETMLWDIFGLDVARVGVETLVIITGMEIVEQLSTKVMAKEIARLKESIA